MTPPHSDVGQPGRGEAGGGCTGDSDIWVRSSCGRDQHFSNDTHVSVPWRPCYTVASDSVGLRDTRALLPSSEGVGSTGDGQTEVPGEACPHQMRGQLSENGVPRARQVIYHISVMF